MPHPNKARLSLARLAAEFFVIVVGDMEAEAFMVQTPCSFELDGRSPEPLRSTSAGRIFNENSSSSGIDMRRVPVSQGWSAPGRNVFARSSQMSCPTCSRGQAGGARHSAHSAPHGFVSYSYVCRPFDRT